MLVKFENLKKKNFFLYLIIFPFYCCTNCFVFYTLLGSMRLKNLSFEHFFLENVVGFHSIFFLNVLPRQEADAPLCVSCLPRCFHPRPPCAVEIYLDINQSINQSINHSLIHLSNQSCNKSFILSNKSLT